MFMVLQTIFVGAGTQTWQMPVPIDRVEIINDGGAPLTVSAGNTVIPLLASDAGFDSVIPKCSSISVIATAAYRIAVYKAVKNIE